MADVWQAELAFDGFVYTPDPAPSLFRRSEWRAGIEAICLPLLDSFPPFNVDPDEGNWYFSVGIADDGTAFQAVQIRGGVSGNNPPLWQSSFLLPIIAGGNPALLTAGGTLTITKDYDGDTMSFAGPLGTQSASLIALDAQFPGLRNLTPLRPRGYAEAFALPDPTGSNPAYDVHDAVAWFNLIGRQNAIAYDTVAFSAADPGSWWPIVASEFDPASGAQGTFVLPWWTYDQTLTRREVHADVLAAEFPEFRIFNTWIRRRTPMPAEAVDLVVYRPTHSVFAAWEAMPDALMLRRTQDDGSTWVDQMIEHGTAAESVSLQVFAGEVWTCYYDGSQIVTQKSQDFGASWSSAMPVPISGTNPRLVISPEGTQFYFYCAGGELRLRRSFDFGATLFDAAAITVATPVVAQDFGAVLAADRSLTVSYIDTGNWITRKSQDWGTTWATV